MVTWSTFLPYILPEVPGAPEPVIAHYTRNAAIEFIEESAIHVVDAAVIDVVANTSVYALDPGSVEYDVCAVKYAWFDDRPLPFVSQEILNDQTGVYWPGRTANTPSGFTQQDQEHLILYPIPTEGLVGGLKMKLIVRPALTSTGVADWIGKRFINEISYGALAALCGMVGKPWTNPDGEKKYRTAFEAAKTKATIDAYRSFTRASLQVGMSRTW